MSMPIVATAVPKMPPTLTPVDDSRFACVPSQKLANRAMRDRDRGHCGGLEADGGARDDVGRRAGLGRLGDVAHRTV